MAKNQNNYSENNPAFIADLLEKLRQQMNSSTEADGADDTASSVINSDDTNEGFNTAAQDAEPMTEETDRVSDIFAEATDDYESDAVLPLYADGMPEPDADESSLSVFSEAEETDDTEVTSAQETVTDEESVTEGDQYTMDLPVPDDAVVNEEPSTPPVVAYSRPVMPDGTRISENARHPVDERYRAMLSVVEPAAAEPEQLIIPIEAAAPDMPVPDEPTAAPIQETAERTRPAEVAPEPDIPTSIWDIPMYTVPIATEEKSTVAEVTDTTAEDVGYSSDTDSVSGIDDHAEETVFHATVRKPKETFADVDFDKTRGTDILREKVIVEPLESIGGEHSETQIERWQQELNRKRRGTRIRSIIIGSIVALLAIFELIPAFTTTVLDFLLITRVPGAIGLIDTQLLIIVCVVGYRPLYRGFAALRFGRVIPETMASFAASVSLIGSIVYYLTGAPDRYLFALTGSLVVLSAILADLCRQEALRCIFRAYAAPGSHFGGVLTHAHEHRLIRDLYPADFDPVLMETEPTSRVDGYVAAARERVEGKRVSMISLVIAAVVAIADLIVLLVMGYGVDFSFWCAMTVFTAILPLSLFALHRFLSHMLFARIAEERVGITGETAVYRYAKCGVMSFVDTEAFPNGSVQVKGIKLCGDFRLDKALYLVSSLFDRVGGPLNGVFRISTADVRISDDVDIRVLAPEGIEAQVNREDVVVGTRAYLEDIGIEIFRDIEDERAEQDGNRVLYVAYRGILIVKFYVRYDISPAFEKNVEYYAKHGVSSVILTADPLMNDALLDKISYISDYDVRFVKRDLASYEEEEKATPRTVDLITYGPRKSLRRMPFFFKKYVTCQRLAFLTSMIGIAVTAAMVPMLLVLVSVETTLFAVLFQLLALLPTAVIGIVIKRMNPNP